MINVLGHIIRPEAVDYISKVEKISVVGNCSVYYTLTLYLNGQKLVLQSDTKVQLDKSLLDIVAALGQAKAMHGGY